MRFKKKKNISIIFRLNEKDTLSVADRSDQFDNEADTAPKLRYSLKALGCKASS